MAERPSPACRSVGIRPDKLAVNFLAMVKLACKRVAQPPVDLSKPIAGDAHWRAIRAHASDAEYRQAVEMVRLRYQFVSNPMLLSNTLRETVARSGLTFREAMLRVAEDDGLHGIR